MNYANPALPPHLYVFLLFVDLKSRLNLFIKNSADSGAAIPRPYPEDGTAFTMLEDLRDMVSNFRSTRPFHTLLFGNGGSDDGGGGGSSGDGTNVEARLALLEAQGSRRQEPPFRAGGGTFGAADGGAYNGNAPGSKVDQVKVTAKYVRYGGSYYRIDHLRTLLKTFNYSGKEHWGWLLSRSSSRAKRKAFVSATVPRPPPSKTDQWGTIFGNQFVFLPFDEADPANAAAALRDYELAFPLGGRARDSVPLFSMDPAALDEPLRASMMDVVMKTLFFLIMGTARAACFSFHSFRIGLACALLAAGYSYAETQAHCRWQTDASIQIYARQNADMFGTRVLAAANQTVSSVVVANFLRQEVELDGDATVAIIDGIAGLNVGGADA